MLPNDRRISLGLAGLAAAALVGALVVPKFSPAVRQRTNVVLRQDDASARVFVDTTWGRGTWGSAPPAMLLGLPFAQTESSLPWMLPSRFTEVPRLDLKAPAIDVLSQEGSHLRARLRSPRGASILALVFAQDQTPSVTVEGHSATLRATPGGQVVGIFGVGTEGVIVEMETTAPFTLLDISPGVPPGTKAAEAVRARPDTATPSQYGDLTAVSTAVTAPRH
jgi:hypothetical protein